MKMYTVVLVLLLLTILIADLFFYRKLKSQNAKPLFIILHLIAPAFFTVLFLYVKFGLENVRNYRVIAVIMWTYFFFLLIYIPKLIHIIFYFLHFLYKKIFKKESVYFGIVRITLSVAVIVIMLLSAYVTPRRFEVTHTRIPIKDLPEAFNGYKIVQISDLHLGSWNKKFKKLKPVIDLVNQQNADIIVFTGDMVNNYAEETEGWTPFFLQLKSKYAKFAVLGNHDYGDYTAWVTDSAKTENRNKINQAIRDFGFTLLLNQHVYLKQGNDSLLLVGVENWGKTAAFRYSNLCKALRGSLAHEPKILLAHDPNQWDAEIRSHKDIVLTLSGHTHAAQLGLKIGKRLFSPAAFVFKHWAGLYLENEQYIYVNRGIGYIGLPMHIGVRPEISVIELVKK
ncbi:MAG: metallophosphoesterase [Bacteroidetes bacterium]|nr:metallophosphoesterase [Bacteroidota bacterium]